MSDFMGYSLLALWAIAFLASGVAGMRAGNAARDNAVGVHLSMPFALWYLIKNSVITAVVGVIVALIINEFWLKGDFWMIVFLSLMCLVNFFVIKSKIQEEHEIWTGVLNDSRNNGYGNDMTSSAHQTTGQSSAANSSEVGECPFVGRVLVDEDYEFLGMNWERKATAFHITPDWKLKLEDGNTIGWIDVDGRIHKGVPLNVDPKATLSGGWTTVKVHSSYIYDGNEKVGEIVSW